MNRPIADLRRVRIVARREFLATVKRPAYLATLILMPLFMLGVSLLPAIGMALSGGPQQMLGLGDPDDQAVILIIDQTGRALAPQALLDWHNDDQARALAEGRKQPDSSAVSAMPRSTALEGFAGLDDKDRGGFSPDARLLLRTAEDEAAATDAVRDGEAKAAWILGPDYMGTSRARVLVRKRNPLNPDMQPGRLAVARLLRRALVEPLGPSEDVMARVLQVMEGQTEVVSSDEASGIEGHTGDGGLGDALSLMVPMLFASFFAMSIFVASGYLLDGIGEEKESRVLEILLSTLTPEELLLGKMIGLGGAGLLQSAFFGVLGLVPLVVMGLLTVGVLPLCGMVLANALGYAVYASLMGASGAVAGNRHEGRQVSAVWTLTAASPMFILPVFLTAPEGAVARLMSLFPLTAPMALTLRLGLGKVAWWEAALSYVGMAAMAVVAWRVGSRVFRVAILATGARPPLRVIWRWVRGIEG